MRADGPRYFTYQVTVVFQYLSPFSHPTQPGAICIAIGILYFLLIRNDPKEHPLVSTREYDYIVENVSALRAKRDQPKELNAVKAKPPTFPWIKVLTSLPIIAQVSAKITLTWAYSLVILKGKRFNEEIQNALTKYYYD